ncbi:hypothetical protein K1T73_09410 [Roseovarius sp. SCSIO 43702]|uniref:hypothetical protein n=1 Tax=Roseovarius sp. SCSIO 43702 TaxID=2823043 RepID=UPI001C73A951|nr:hypothetical protein [Roseovarius sp. SCSIO 43702]QYX55333.1 hypothetical protein K1T73_09410 [Roseovarius sp. SCSIO 43702]
MRYLVSILALCLLTTAAQAERNKDRPRILVLVNACETETFQFIVQHSPAPEKWNTAGWFTLSPGERIAPQKNGRDLLHRDNATLAVYAENPSGTQGIRGDHRITYKGDTVKARFVTRFIRGKYVEFWLRCD